MQKTLSGINVSFLLGLFLLSPQKASQIISHRFYLLLKLFFIAIIVCFIVQDAICFGDVNVERDKCKNDGKEKISSIINAYDKQLANSIGKNDPRYIVKSTSLDLLENQKIEELHNKVDNVKAEGEVTPEIKKRFSQIINEIVMATSMDSQTILKSGNERDWWARVIVGISAGFFFIIIGSILYYVKVSDLVIQSIRPIISLSLTILIFMLCWYALYNHLIEFKELFPLILALYGPIVGFYFGERSALKVPGEDRKEIIISPDVLPNGNTDSSYSEKLSASGGTQPYKFEIETGNLPNNLNIDLKGKISGIPTTDGTYKFTVKVTDKLNKVSSKDYEIEITPV